MCLERCGEDIQSDLAQIANYSTILTAVSFEDYDLGENSTLIWNEFTYVNGIIQSYGLLAYPMITTANISKIRQLCSNPQPFIEDAVLMAIQYNYTGYNIDFEPTGDDIDDNDAYIFASFLDEFADVLHEKGITLSVDVATWSPFWNYSLLAATRVDKVISMDTYVAEFDLFTSRLIYGVNTVGIQKLGIGLETVNDNNGQPFTTQELEERFQLIQQFNIQEIDIWEEPLPDNFWPFLKEFLSNTTKVN